MILVNNNSFHRILWDHAIDPKNSGFIKLKKNSEIKKVILCSGKVYFDLLDAREKLKKDDVVFLELNNYILFQQKLLSKSLNHMLKMLNFIGAKKNQKIWELGFQ